MKELDGNANVSVPAPIERCFELLQDLEHYPDWYPEAVREVKILEHDAAGSAIKARTMLHVAAGPLVRDFRLTLVVDREHPRSVRLTRLANEPSDRERFQVIWTLREHSGTQINLALHANLSVPRLLPVSGLGDKLAQGFVGAAARQLR